MNAQLQPAADGPTNPGTPGIYNSGVSAPVSVWYFAFDLVGGWIGSGPMPMSRPMPANELTDPP